ncbi:MAG: COR domain-containing protein [Cyanobacteria bacterium P01_C01_bin.120]
MTRDDLLRLIDQAAAEGWKELDLSRKELTKLPPKIKQLTQLELLNLRFNRLSDLPSEIGQLKKLKSLYLRHNQLSKLPPEIRQLTNLQSFDLSNNRLSGLPWEITQLASLQLFDLSNNRLSGLPWEITQLASLQSLELSSNPLSNLLPEIGLLTKLKLLVLSSNSLSNLLPEIGQLINLQSLYLSYNTLNSIPSEIGQLTKLQSLFLRSNQLSSLPPTIGQLTNLKTLDLNDNRLINLPPEISKISSLQAFDLNNNKTLIDPPPEIVSSGTKRTLNYLRQQLEQGQDFIYEAKFLIVGEGGAGKTSLAKKIQDESYNLDSDEASTEGIDVIRWKFNLQKDRPFWVNMWDFGGQEIYHATHQFFLTKRSLYALVVDTREDNTDLYYWLNIVRLLSKDSPAFIVKNEKQDRTCQVDERQLRREFLNLKEISATNLKTNRGLGKIKSIIQQHIYALPHVGQALPKKWVVVRKTLEADARNHISFDEYCQICEANNFQQREDQLQLSDYLHDLGVCLHFQADPLLRKILILKPEWSTTAVYRALDNKEVQENLGRFSRAQLDTIWSDREYADMRDELLQLMMRFKLCYKISGADNEYIAPQLLDVEQPTYDWDDTNNLLLRYHYAFMPKGILTRLIVEMHKFIEAQTLVWKSGVVLTNKSTRAEVIELYHKSEIHLRVSGVRPKDLLTVVTHEIDKINASYDRLQVQKLIPCNCSGCDGDPNPHFYQLDKLYERIDNRKPTIECGRPPYENVPVWGLIDNATDPLTGFQDLPRGQRPAALAAKGDTKLIELQKESWPIQTESVQPEIFISFKCGTDSDKIADQIGQVLQDQGVSVRRDCKDLEYKDSIHGFMEELGRGKYVIAVIDDAYLKSENCMFELVEMLKHGDFLNRIFPIVLPDAQIYRAAKRIQYVQHWEREIADLEEAMKTVSAANMDGFRDEIDLYTRIRATIAELTTTLKRMNTLKAEDHIKSGFTEILTAIEQPQA